MRKGRRPSTQILSFEERETQRQFVYGAREKVRVAQRRTQLSQAEFGKMLRPPRTRSLIDKLERGAARLTPPVLDAIKKLLLKVGAEQASAKAAS